MTMATAIPTFASVESPLDDEDDALLAPAAVEVGDEASNEVEVGDEASNEVDVIRVLVTSPTSEVVGASADVVCAPSDEEVGVGEATTSVGVVATGVGSWSVV